MFGVDSTEFVIVAVLALIFIGPKDLPKVMRTVGYWVGRMRGMARHFTSGLETMMREAELEEMEKKWREENERIMRLHPPEAHYPEPGQPDEMPPVVEPHAEDALRRRRLQHGNRPLGRLAGLRIEPAENLLPERGVPHHALRVDDHVVRLARAGRQIVFGVDDARGTILRTRQRLEGVAPLSSRTEVEGAQVFALATPGLLLPLGVHSTAADARRRRSLHHEWNGERGITRHALDDFREFAGVMPRTSRKGQHVAVRAATHRGFLVVSAWETVQPFRVCQLRGQVARLFQLQIRRRHTRRGHGHRQLACQVVADRADAHGIGTGLETRSRKTETSLLVGDDRRGQRGARTLHRHEHAFHRAFLG